MLLDAALYFALFTAALKLGDLLLRPQQKAAFQSAVETVVLWLDYRRPIRLLRRLVEVETRHPAFISVVGLGAATFVFHKASGRLTGLVSVLLLFTFCPIVSALPYWRWRHDLFDYLGIKGPLTAFFRRTALLFAASLVFSVLILAISESSPSAELVISPVLIIVMTLMYLKHPRIFFAYLAIGPVCFISLLSAFILSAADLFVRALRFIGWRIVEYVHGAWAAALLIGTVALAIARLFVGS